MVRVTGLEPTESCAQSRCVISCATLGYEGVERFRHIFQFSTWDLNFPLPVPGGLAYLLRQRWSSSFCYCGRYSCCLCPCSYNVLIIVSAVAPLAIQCYLQAILHEFDNGLLEQILDALKNHLRKVGFLHFSHPPVGSLYHLSEASIVPADEAFSGFRFL